MKNSEPIYYWISANLYVGSDDKLYRIDCRRVAPRTWVWETPVRIGKGDIIKRGGGDAKQQST